MVERMSLDQQLNLSLFALLRAIQNDDLDKLYAMLEIPEDLFPNHESYHMHILQKLTDIFESACNTYSHRDSIGSCQNCDFNVFCPVHENTLIHTISENLALYLTDRNGYAKEEVIKSLKGIIEVLNLKRDEVQLN